MRLRLWSPFEVYVIFTIHPNRVRLNCSSKYYEPIVSLELEGTKDTNLWVGHYLMVAGYWES